MYHEEYKYIHPAEFVACLYFVGGTEIDKGGPLLAAKISPGGPKFSLQT